MNRVASETPGSARLPELPAGFDLDAMLAPVAGETPAGVDLRQDFSAQSLYFRMRDARAEARQAERKADEGDATAGDPAAEWRKLREFALQALTTTTKDLEIAAWLTEALVRSDGLRGLAAGAMLIAGLAENFWDGLYPLPDEDGMLTRVAPLTGLNGEGGGEGTLSQPLRKLPLFQRADGAAFTFWQYEQSVKLSGIADPAQRKKRVEAGVLPFETVEAEARAAGVARFAALLADAAQAHREWERMTAALERRAGPDAPPTSAVRDLLASIRDVAARFAPAIAPAEAEAAPDGAAAEEAPEATAGTAAPRRIATREDALRVLGELSEFFRRTEPHSPLAYTLEEAVRRGRLTWPELLAEIVPDQTSRSAILNSLGIKPPAPEPAPPAKKA